MSGFERHSFVAGILLLLAGTVAMFAREDAGGLAALLGTIGLGVLGICAISRGARRYRANAAASVPRSVGRVGTSDGRGWVRTSDLSRVRRALSR